MTKPRPAPVAPSHTASGGDEIAGAETPFSPGDAMSPAAAALRQAGLDADAAADTGGAGPTPRKAPAPSRDSPSRIVGGGVSGAPGTPSARAAAAARKREPRPSMAVDIQLPTDRPGVVIPAAALFYGWIVSCFACAWLALRWLGRWDGGAAFGLRLGGGLVPGLALGVASAVAYHRSRSRKGLLNSVLNVTPGRKGLYAVLGGVPPWVSFQDREKVDWLNTMLAELWPFYDKAIAKAVRDAVEPLMMQYKPPGLIKAISFKTLTFGDAPFRIENIWVEDEGEDHVLLEVAFRWAGEANIAIAIDLPAGGDFTRMVPKVTDLRVAGVARVRLSPLMGEIPGFGAAVVALRRPPLIHFVLDFGAAFGGSYSAKAIRLWLDPFIRTTLTSMVVWPNRIVVPMAPESVTGPIDHLHLRHQGLLVLNIVQAADLPSADRNGKSDPFVEVSAQATAVHKTRVVKASLDPVWNETLHVLVQEPKTQAVRVEVFDHDVINVKELLQVNILKGARDVLGSKTLLGRVSLPVRDFEAGVQSDAWYPLGTGEFGAEDGTGVGCGRLRIKATFWPWEALYAAPRRSRTGALLVTVKAAADLPTLGAAGTPPTAFFKLTLDGVTRSTRTASKSTDPAWGEKLEWVGVPAGEVLEVTAWDSSLLGNTCLGAVEVDVASEIAASPEQPIHKVWYLEEVPADGATGVAPPAAVTLIAQWVPYDFEP
jgi:hypothetical protein